MTYINLVKVQLITSLPNENISLVGMQLIQHICTHKYTRHISTFMKLQIIYNCLLFDLYFTTKVRLRL